MNQAGSYSLVFASESNAAALAEAMPGECTCVTSRAELVAAIAKRRPAIAFVDLALIPQIEADRAGVPVVGIIEDTLAHGLEALNTFPWLSHVLSTTMLTTPILASHITTLKNLLAFGPEQSVLGPEGVGRVALLTSSGRRESRFERMREFFAQHGISPRTITQLNDIAEELVTNALYDAPVEAGYFKAPVPRTQEVEMPPEHACEVSYGVERGSVFVRIRDPFGAFTRARLMGVLNRCNSNGVVLDESRGGAGLGLWRVFSAASSIGIAVLSGRLTDIVVRIETKQGRSIRKQLLALHLFFPDALALDGAQGRFAADHDHDLMDDSFTAIVA